MLNVTMENGRTSLVHLRDVLQIAGSPVTVRGQDTLELRNLTIEVLDPYDVGMYGIGRNWNLSIAVAEALQLVSGASHPRLMEKITPTFRRFMDGSAFFGAYGPRIAGQMPLLVQRLQDDPQTRQGWVSVWDPMRDLATPGMKDYPCTLGFLFTVRDGELLMETHMRSNDLWWGWSYDLFQFTFLQKTLAHVLGYRAGPYIHYVNSFHMYLRDVEAADELDVEAAMEPPQMRYDGIHARTWNDAAAYAYDALMTGDDVPDDVVPHYVQGAIKKHL